MTHALHMRMALVLVLALVLALALPAAAQEISVEETVADILGKDTPVDLSETVGDLMGHAEEEQQAAAQSAGNMAELREEVEFLKESLSQLQQTLDLMVNRIMADLEEENRQLRRELRQAHATIEAAGLGANARVPRPNQDLLEDVMSQAGLDGDAGAEEGIRYGSALDDGLPPDEFGYTVIEDWGRSPEVAAEMGGNTTSLKGMICLVPPHSLNEDLEGMAREIREAYNAYDNLNVEVFDHPKAAQEFADNNFANPQHRVLSISKHRASGRDSVTLYENGQPRPLDL